MHEVVLKRWLAERKSVDDVFDIVLQKHDKYLFELDDLGTWVSYVNKLVLLVKFVHIRNPRSIALCLRYYRSRLTRKRMLDKAEQVSATKAIAGWLAEELWLSEGKSTKAIFNLEDGAMTG